MRPVHRWRSPSGGRRWSRRHLAQVVPEAWIRHGDAIAVVDGNLVARQCCENAECHRHAMIAVRDHGATEAWLRPRDDEAVRKLLGISSECAEVRDDGSDAVALLYTQLLRPADARLAVRISRDACKQGELV